jgi:glutathione synthase/RimK-type ligase-like ATP-grasp enzyme
VTAVIGTIALATCAVMPVESDEGPLVAAFERAGVATRWAVWDDPDEDWSRYVGVLIRTTWDYIDKIDAFRAWVDAAGAATTLWNPAPVVRWNSHKRYLPELAARGVPVVPTTYVATDGRASLDLLPDDDGHGFVVKPAESIGAIGLTRWGSDDAGRAGAVAAAEVLRSEGQDVLIQPLVPAIAEAGETSVIFIDGQLSHAVRKVPAAGDIRSQPEYGSEVTAVEASPAQVDLGRRELATTLDALGLDGDHLLYARVDCVDHQGTPSLMELELIEPDLYVGYDDGAADRVVAAILARVGR